MRYNLMLQLVSLIIVMFVGTAALFAWVQNRPPADTKPPSQIAAALSHPTE
jgi:hypothetical protein